MDKKLGLTWEACNETEMINALDVLYEMAMGYLVGELRDEHPMVYQKVINQDRFRNQLTNNVRFSIDAMLAELIKEYGGHSESGTV